MVKKNILTLIVVSGLCLFSCNKNKAAKNTGDNAPIKHQEEQPVLKESSEKNEAADHRKIDSTKTIHTEVEGVFVAENCENGRFSIVIANLNGRQVFKVLDDNKVILSGKAEVSKTSSGGINVIMGNMGGLYVDGVLTIQNYGNSMNEFENFTQCEDKYLEFTKQ